MLMLNPSVTHSEATRKLTLGLNDLKLAKWLAFVPHPCSTPLGKIGSRDVRRFRPHSADESIQSEKTFDFSMFLNEPVIDHGGRMIS
jgi:hypothetical protein